MSQRTKVLVDGLLVLTLWGVLLLTVVALVDLHAEDTAVCRWEQCR